MYVLKQSVKHLHHQTGTTRQLHYHMLHMFVLHTHKAWAGEYEQGEEGWEGPRRVLVRAVGQSSG